ncbi:MAG: tetratricopeptide repeat protein [Akkermansiaceae bacterium]
MKHRVYTSTVTSITTLTLAASALTVSAQTPAPVAEPVVPQLKADPGNDYFARVNQIYKSAAMAKDFSLREQYYKQSIPLLQDYLRQFPDHKNAEAANYYLAECYFNTGKVREALTVYNKIVAKYRTGPYVAASTYRLARDYYSKGDYMSAAKYFEMTAGFSAVPADKTKALYYQAQAYMQAKRSDLAAPLYAKVSDAGGINPFREDAALSYGKLSLKSGDYQESLNAFEKLILPNQSEDIKAEAAYHAGVAANGLKKLDIAEKYFKMSMLSNSQKWKGQAQTGLMGIRYVLKDYQGVIKLLSRGKFEMSEGFKTKQGFLLGHSYFKLDQYASAIDHFIDVEIHGKGTDDAFKAGYYKLLCFYNIKNASIPEKVDRFLEGYAVNNGRHKFIHQALLMKAETLFAKRQYDEASKVYSAIGADIIDEKYLPEMLFRKGYCLSKVGNFAGAANSLTEFVEKYPENQKVMEALILRAGAYSKLENAAKALRDYDHVIKNSKDAQYIAIALQKSGVIQFQDKNYDDMIDRYKQLVQEHPKLESRVIANANYWICRAYFKQKKYRLGLQYLEDSWKLDKLTFVKQISMLRVIGHFSLKNYEETENAIAIAENAGLQNKIPLAVYRWLGEFYYNDSNFEKAADLLEKGIEKGAASASPIAIWRYLSKAQMQTGKFQEAFISVSNLLSMEEEKPRIVDALLDKAKIQMELGKDGDAKRTADSALEMNPTGRIQAELLKVIGDFHYNIGEPEKAANHYVLLVDSAKDLSSHPQILDRLAKSLLRAGNAAEAKRYADQLRAIYPAYKREQ